MTDASPRPWRTGTSPGTEGLTVYSHEGDMPRGTLLGMYRHPEDAALAVEAVNAYGDPGPGYHVLVTVDPDRNHGRASISSCQAPIHAAAGLLRAGETPEAVRAEFGLSAAALVVVAALSQDFADLAADLEDEDDVPPAGDACRPVRVPVDGHAEVIRVHAAEPMSEQARAALGEVVSAARRHILAANPHLGVIQELLAAARIARLCIPDGVVHTPFGTRNGTEVKDRLRAAAWAARGLLTPPKVEGDIPEAITE